MKGVRHDVVEVQDPQDENIEKVLVFSSPAVRLYAWVRKRRQHAAVLKNSSPGGGCRPPFGGFAQCWQRWAGRWRCTGFCDGMGSGEEKQKKDRKSPVCML